MNPNRKPIPLRLVSEVARAIHRRNAEYADGMPLDHFAAAQALASIEKAVARIMAGEDL